MTAGTRQDPGKLEAEMKATIKEKRRAKLILTGAFLMGALMLAFSGDLQPATVANDCYRTTSGDSLGAYWRGATIRLTNWVAYADAEGTTTQNLHEVDVTIAVGNTTTASNYTGTVADTNNGLFWCDITIPTNSGAQYVEVTLTDTGQTPNVIYTYPWYALTTKERIGE